MHVDILRYLKFNQFMPGPRLKCSVFPVQRSAYFGALHFLLPACTRDCKSHASIFQLGTNRLMSPVSMAPLVFREIHSINTIKLTLVKMTV